MIDKLFADCGLGAKISESQKWYYYTIMYLLLACHSLQIFLAWQQCLGYLSCRQSQPDLLVMLPEGRQSVNKELEINENISMNQNIVQSLPRILSNRGCMLDICVVFLSCLVTYFSWLYSSMSAVWLPSLVTYFSWLYSTMSAVWLPSLVTWVTHHIKHHKCWSHKTETRISYS